MYLPLDDVMFVAERRGGVSRNGTQVRVTSERKLNHTLVAFGMDPIRDERLRLAHSQLLTRLTGGVRNIRATNCLYDFCYTLDGRFGGCVNLNCKIWDIAPIALMLPEAGGIFSDLQGEPIAFDLSSAGAGRKYRVMGASRFLHKQLVRLTR
jgi:fructose-1,6-bisphosphatase/inositol monophosphatase family enzyme